MLNTHDLLKDTIKDSNTAVSMSLEKQTITALEKYLRSSIFDDIGPKIAKRIVSTFGIMTVKVIETSPDRLSEVKGIGRKRMLNIKNGWTLQRKLMKTSAVLAQSQATQRDSA